RVGRAEPPRRSSLGRRRDDRRTAAGAGDRRLQDGELLPPEARAPRAQPRSGSRRRGHHRMRRVPSKPRNLVKRTTTALFPLTFVMVPLLLVLAVSCSTPQKSAPEPTAGRAPVVESDESQKEAAARVGGPKGIAVAAETERTRKYLKNYRVF